MRCVLQRVSHAAVTVDGATVSQIDRGLLALAGIAKGDTPETVEWMARKIIALRLFADAQGKMNLSLRDLHLPVLAVSQFTLCADTSAGRRPSFQPAMEPSAARPLFEQLCAALTAQGISVSTGVFGADMAVSLVNDGPVTFVIDSPRSAAGEQSGEMTPNAA